MAVLWKDESEMRGDDYGVVSGGLLDSFAQI